MPWIVEWTYLQPESRRAVSIGRTEEEAKSSIFEAFEGFPGLEFQVIRLLTEEDKQGMSDDIDEVITEMITTFNNKTKNLN